VRQLWHIGKSGCVRSLTHQSTDIEQQVHSTAMADNVDASSPRCRTRAEPSRPPGERGQCPSGRTRLFSQMWAAISIGGVARSRCMQRYRPPIYPGHGPNRPNISRWPVFPRGIREHQVDVKMRTLICFALPFSDIDHLSPFWEGVALEYLNQHEVRLRVAGSPDPGVLTHSAGRSLACDCQDGNAARWLWPEGRTRQRASELDLEGASPAVRAGP
jgi:hypothetical protein